MRDVNSNRATWKAVLKRERFLPLPVAHDALTARLIERAGFHAYQIGGFALVGAMHAVPDIDLDHLGENSEAARRIIASSSLPVLVDADDGYGDVKNVTRTVREYEYLGASALFMEDQRPPKRCGHMDNKQVIDAAEMEKKVRAAVAARRTPDLFLLARTDAIQPLGLDEALRRGERYLKAGADGIYLEGPRTESELERIGRAFHGVPLATSVLERGGKTPWLAPREFERLGYSMVLYPSTVIFQATNAIARALRRLHDGQPADVTESVDMDQFEEIVDLQHWKEIEKRLG
ncbi:MAG TPA: isocitrate lyase/PEP mutase family protein [Chthonomonadaceae bacterium]|nr:isocitrate lyase/PEP mutase family protein [Chthonomonadaceae bacterium]